MKRNKGKLLHQVRPIRPRASGVKSDPSSDAPGTITKRSAAQPGLDLPRHPAHKRNVPTDKEFP